MISEWWQHLARIQERVRDLSRMDISLDSAQVTKRLFGHETGFLASGASRMVFRRGDKVYKVALTDMNGKPWTANEDEAELYERAKGTALEAHLVKVLELRSGVLVMPYVGLTAYEAGSDVDAAPVRNAAKSIGVVVCDTHSANFSKEGRLLDYALWYESL